MYHVICDCVKGYNCIDCIPALATVKDSWVACTAASAAARCVRASWSGARSHFSMPCAAIDIQRAVRGHFQSLQNWSANRWGVSCMIAAKVLLCAHAQRGAPMAFVLLRGLFDVVPVTKRS